MNLFWWIEFPAGLLLWGMLLGKVWLTLLTVLGGGE